MCPGFPFLELPCMKGIFSSTTADGRNPAPPGMYKTLQIMGYLPYQLVIAGFLPSTVVPV